MRSMDPQIAKQESEYILMDVLRSRSKDDIIREVCWRTGCSWIEAEYLVERTMRENKKVIRQEKSPIRLGISILATVVGFIWTVSTIIRIATPLIRYLGENGTLTGYILPRSTWGLAVELLVALTMIVVGMILTMQQMKAITR
jgi:hypothetical protein